MTSVQSLIEEESTCIAFLKHQQKNIYAPNLKVTASMIMKKYAQVLSFSVLDSMVRGGKSKIIPLSACYISEDLDIQVDSLQITYTDSRLEVWEEFFTHHLFPLLNVFHNVTNLPLIILWENIAVRINSFFRKAMDRHPDHQQKIVHLAEEMNQLDGSYFNSVKHPMSTYLTAPKSLGEHKTRCTCCYFHKLEKKKEKLTHCLVCPLGNQNCSS